MSLHQGIGIIFGANLGSTATAWLVASLGLNLNISALAIPMIVFGIVLYLQSNRSIKGFGNILAGLGFFFFGIAIMKEGFDAYQDSLDLTTFSADGLWGQLLFVFIGILATVILQSSGASMAIILTTLAAGQITYLSAMALAIGANVGTTVTAMIGAMASNIDGKRIAIAHLLFNVITGLVAFSFLSFLGKIVNFSSDLLGIDPLNFTLKLSIFHTLFNLLGIIIMRPLVSPMERFLTTKIKDKQKSPAQPKYLNETSLAYPQTSLEVLLKETNHLFDICFEAIAHGMGLSRTSMLDKKKMKAISMVGTIEYHDANVDEIYYNRIKNIYAEIVKFGTRAQSKYGEAKFVNTINSVLEANRYFVEVVKDIKDLQPNILKYCDSENEVLRNEYNRLRKRIAKFIRIVFYYQDFKIIKPSLNHNQVEVMDKINKERLLLQTYIENSKKYDVLYNGAISQLIIDKKLTGTMVTSLINDSRIVNSINKHLVKASALLYLNADVMLREQADE